MEPAECLPEPGPSTFPDQAGGGDRVGGRQDEQGGAPGEHDEQVPEGGEDEEEAHDAQDGGDGAVGDVGGREPGPGLPGVHRVDVQQSLHQGAGQASGGGHDRDAVDDAGDPDHDELCGANEHTRQRLTVATEGSDPQLDHQQGQDDRAGDPEGVGVNPAHRAVLGQVRGEEVVLDAQHELQQPQAGVPDPEHGGGPPVGDDLARRVPEVGEGVEVVPPVHRLLFSFTGRRPRSRSSNRPGRPGQCRARWRGPELVPFLARAATGRLLGGSTACVRSARRRCVPGWPGGP